MSRFAVLGDDDDDDVSDSELETRRYSFQEIIDLEQFSRDHPPPSTLTSFPEVFLSEWQPLECSTFRPPTREINSQSAQDTKSSRRPPPRTTPRAPPPPPPAQKSPAERSETPDIEQGWDYRDPMDRVIGPFPAKRMHEWLEKRAIDASLFVRRAGSNDKFQQIATIFPDVGIAFLDQGIARSSGEPQRTTLVAFEVSDDELAWDGEGK
jgi:hypothetical protein